MHIIPDTGAAGFDARKTGAVLSAARRVRQGAATRRAQSVDLRTGEVHVTLLELAPASSPAEAIAKVLLGMLPELRRGTPVLGDPR
jgi:hypothetical protein